MVYVDAKEQQGPYFQRVKNVLEEVYGSELGDSDFIVAYF